MARESHFFIKPQAVVARTGGTTTNNALGTSLAKPHHCKTHLDPEAVLRGSSEVVTQNLGIP